MSSSARILRYSLLCLALAAQLAAQTGLGTVKGTVLDASKSAVPNAKIALTNQATGVMRGTQTTAIGFYYFGAVPPGQYVLTVESAGFKKWSGTLLLEAGQMAVIDPAMEVGSVDAVVEVTSVASPITTTGMEINDVKDALRIQQLPLNGRDVRNLFNLTPGVEGGGVPRVNGAKVGSTDILLDGISLVDRFGGGLRGGVSPGLDTIQEYRIETVGSTADTSRPATVTLVTKSGTNEIHGGAWETHRNNFGGLLARAREDSNARPPQLIRNEFGVGVGGPIIKNKTFWYGSYEGNRLRRANFARTGVPTPAMWAGDFSQALDDNGNKLTMYDPFSTRADGTRVPFPNSRVPTNRITPFSQTMQSVSPDPLGPNASQNPFLGPNFETFYPNQDDGNTYTIKLDHVLTKKDNLSGRFTNTHFTNKLFGGRFGFPKPGSTDAGGSGLTDARIYSIFVRWNRVWAPTLLSETQLSTNRAPKASGTLANDVNWSNKLGLPNPFGTTGWPTICTDSYNFFYYGCWDGDNRKDENLTAHQLEHNTTWIKGKHTVKFGGKLRYEYNNIRELQQAQGSHSFYSSWTGLYDPKNDDVVPYTGVGMASILMGTPTFLSNQYNRGYFYFQQKEVGLYVQDSWKVHPRVTLELGVRWDMWTPYHEKYNRLVNVDLSTFASKFEVITPGSTKMEDIRGIPPAVLASWRGRGLTWKTAQEAGFPDALIPGDHNNFGPRIGGAIRLNKGFIVRTGFGQYFWTMPLSQILQTSRSNPPLNLRFANNIDDQNGRVPFYALSNAPGSNDFVGKAAVDINGAVILSSNSQSMMPWQSTDWKDNRLMSWHLTIERQIMKETALRLSYIGNQGRDLEQRLAINSIESEFNYQARTGLARPGTADLRRANRNWNFAAANHTGYSNNHSLQAEIERRYSNGLAFQWFYTFTRALNTTDVGGFTSGNGNINATDGGNSVPESIQILGAPKLSYADRLKLIYYNAREVPAQRIRYNWIYDLPMGKGKKFGSGANRVLDAVIGGWQLAGIGDWRSGRWLGVGTGGYLFGDPTLSADQRLLLKFGGRQQRLWFRGDFNPALATNVDQTALQALIPLNRAQRVFHPIGADFSNRVAQVLANGTVRLTSISDNVNWNARNFFRGPGAWNVDSSIFKNFSFTERYKLRFTADFFNVLNHPLDVEPNATTGLQDLSRQANTPRIIQFSLRFQW
ncbi:MAG: carboxypeptidase regulatory-like domain-containing protein [Acidobacteria bacterium]|nr:carboxypeptidase regulatory-like domain-containing protein [Acidobacteriota bacterium]